MATEHKILLELRESSLVKIMNGLKSLDEYGVTYKILEEQQPTFRIEPHEYSYSLGRKGYKVLKLIAEGCTYNEVANKMGITVDGVRYYVKKVFKTLNVNNGRDAVRIYLTELRGREVV